MSEPKSMWNKNFICVVIANFLLCYGHAAVNPLVATYMTHMNATAELTGFLTGMFYGIAFALRPVTGPVATKLDKRKLLIFVFVIGAVANLGYALFRDLAAFTAFRFLSGAQYSLVGALLMTLAGDHLPSAKMAYGLGIYGIGGAVANALAPATGEALLRFGTRVRDEDLGFMLMFILGAALFVLAIIPAVIVAPDKKSRAEIASTGAWYKNILTPRSAPAAIVLMLVLIPNALLNTYLFEFGMAYGIEGISAFYIVMAISLSVSRPLSGYLTDKFGIPRVLIPALVIYAAALFVVGSSRSLPPMLVGAVLAAIGYGSAQPSLQAMSMQAESPLRRGVASNTVYMGMDLGLFVGPFLGGLVYANSNYSTMYKAGAAPILIALVCFIIISHPNVRRHS